VPRLLLTEDAKQDLAAIRLVAPKLAVRLGVLLQELIADDALLPMLTTHDFGSDRQAAFHVSRWQEHWRRGKDLWRLKFWELEDQGIPYRVIYALKRGTGNHYVLAIVGRDFNYDRNHLITQRILRAYDDL
jgi:hypothetical protein